MKVLNSHKVSQKVYGFGKWWEIWDGFGLRAPDGGAGLGYRLVCTARRRGVSFSPEKETKTGQRGTGLSPLQTPLALGCAGYEYYFSAAAEK